MLQSVRNVTGKNGMTALRRMGRLSSLAISAWAVQSGAVQAQACVLPAPFGYTADVNGTATWEGDANQDCALRARLDAPAGGSDLKSAFTNGTLTPHRGRLRAKFHV